MFRDVCCVACGCHVGSTDGRRLFAAGIAFDRQTRFACLSCGRVQAWQPGYPRRPVALPAGITLPRVGADGRAY